MVGDFEGVSDLGVFVSRLNLIRKVSLESVEGAVLITNPIKGDLSALVFSVPAGATIRSFGGIEKSKYRGNPTLSEYLAGRVSLYSDHVPPPSVN